MKTVKALKTATIWNGIFCFSWIVTVICFVFDSTSIGVLFTYGWMLNPMPLISCYRCLKAYLKDRKVPMYRQQIGKKWLWIFLFPVITTILWALGGFIFVEQTGGV